MSRVFVFKEAYNIAYKAGRRQKLYAIPENNIEVIISNVGSENCYLKVNGIEIDGSFESLVKQLGERVDIR